MKIAQNDLSRRAIEVQLFDVRSIRLYQGLCAVLVDQKMLHMHHTWSGWTFRMDYLILLVKI